jgi:hypothetical protein
MDYVTLTFTLTCLLGAIVYVVALLAARYASTGTTHALTVATLPDYYRPYAHLVRWISPGIVDCAMTDAAIAVDFLSRHSTWPIVGASK